MKKLITIILLAASLPVAALSGGTGEKDGLRIVSAGNGITEIIYALGAGDQVVAVDSTSVYPADVHKLPKLGYHKQMSAEGILALRPSILIGSDDMGPPATITQLESAGLEVAALPLQNSADNIQHRIETLAGLLNREQEGKQLWQSIAQNLEEAQNIASDQKKPRVLFLLAMGGRTPSVSGRDTSANTLIELAGGINPAADQFTSYKPLSNESLLVMAPDIIIYSDHGKGTTPEQLIDLQPVLKQTPAVKKGRLIAIDPGMLLGGLGPRTGDLALELAKEFFPSET